MIIMAKVEKRSLKIYGVHKRAYMRVKDGIGIGIGAAVT